MPALQKFIGPVLTLLLGAMLLATIYFTLLDLQWVAFLAGVLFAAVSATTSQTAKAQWLVARRNRQLERGKAALAKESARGTRLAESLEIAEARFRLINDALPVMMLFVDNDELCRYHNRAFQDWCGRSFDLIDGLPLHAVVSDAVYRDIKLHCAQLRGQQMTYAAAWPRRAGEREDVTVTLLPYPPGMEQRATGFFVLIVRAADIVKTPETPVDTVGDVVIVSQEGGETVYLESMTEQLSGGNDPRDRLVKALQEDQFILFAQKIEPLAPVPDQQRCLEVLLRLKEEEDHMLPPGGFFPVAEHYNLMGEIDRWVVRNLLKWSAARQRDGRGWRMPLCCVNLSGTTLSDPEFARYVQSELRRNNVSGDNLCFEITELDLISHRRDLRSLMALLAPQRCRFTVDGFGAARVVSFTPLKDFKFDFLKIDGSVVQNMLTDPAVLAQTRAIALAARKTGMRTIAAFVESDETLAKLREIGVDYAQGFGIGKPGPIG